MAAPASGVDPPTLPPRGNKRKKGRKLRSSAEGGRSACRGATNEATNGATRKGAGGWVDGDGYPRGKQFLLIQRSHPHGGASLVDPLLDLSPSRSVSFPPFLSGSLSASLFLFLYISLPFSFSLSLALFSSLLAAREPGFCEQVLLSLPPSTVIRRTLLFPPFRRIAGIGGLFEVHRSIRSPSRSSIFDLFAHVIHCAIQ